MNTVSEPLEQPAATVRVAAGDPELLKSTSDFSNVDRLVKEMPDEHGSSMGELVRYFEHHTEGEAEMTRAVFLWVARNIEYDGRAYSLDDIPRMDAEEVFFERKGVCFHYSILFEELATMAGLRAKTLLGHATGYPSSILLGDTGHAWNAVRIEGEWYLLDVTWSSGYLDQEFEFHPYEENDAYFLIDPGVFVDTHFPEEAFWQLLPNPVSESEFLRRAG